MSDTEKNPQERQSVGSEKKNHKEKRKVNRRSILSGMAGAGVAGLLGSVTAKGAEEKSDFGGIVLDPSDYYKYLGTPSPDPGTQSQKSWLKENVPFFDCPDENITEIYYFRWLVTKKAMKKRHMVIYLKNLMRMLVGRRNLMQFLQQQDITFTKGVGFETRNM